MPKIDHHQERMVAEIDQDAGNPLVVAHTGAGKTRVLAAHIARHENEHALVVVHSREVAFQFLKTLEQFGVKAGLILHGEPKSPMARVQVCTIQSLNSQYLQGDKELPPARFIYFDEAHRSTAPTYRKLVDRYPGARIIGASATPISKRGRGLGMHYDRFVFGPDYDALVEVGRVVRVVYYSLNHPDLTGVRTVAGDYHQGQLEHAMDNGQLVGEAVGTWHKIAERRPSIYFCVSCAHGAHIAHEFERSGVRTAYIDGKTGKDERDLIREQMTDGRIEVVVNCMVYVEGVDIPAASVVGILRPTQSFGLYRQMVGRVLRAYPGKADALVIDHAGAVLRHGLVEDEVAWTLSQDFHAVNTTQSHRETHDRGLCVCPKCDAIRIAGEPCDRCGYLPAPRRAFVDTVDGDLVRITKTGKRDPSTYTDTERREFYRSLLALAREHGCKDGLAAHNYKRKFGSFPPWSWKDHGPIDPLPEAIGWDRHCYLRYLKAREAADA